MFRDHTRDDPAPARRDHNDGRASYSTPVVRRLGVGSHTAGKRTVVATENTFKPTFGPS